jgi:hypothetical protein
MGIFTFLPFFGKIGFLVLKKYLFVGGEKVIFLKSFTIVEAAIVALSTGKSANCTS